MPLKERIYSSEGSAMKMGEILKGLWKELPSAHALGFRFAERSIRSKFRQSIFGVLWAFFPPLVTALIWIILNKYHVVRLGDDVGAPYPVFVITGMMLWSVFSSSMLMPLQVMQSNRNTLVKINFPRESLLFNAFYEVLFNAVISMIIIIIFLFAFKVPITIHCLLFIPTVFALILLGMSIGLLIMPFAFLYKDIQFILPSVLQFAMYLTPVVYAQPIYKGAGKILALNPVTPLLTSGRCWLLGIENSIPLWHYGTIIGISFFLLMIGVALQRITMQILIERMGT